MCGITGLMDSSANKDQLVSMVSEMAGTIRHRGPDNFGVFSDDDAGIALAHQRLSIQDLSPLGNQPMSSASSRYVIVFNGEIYNFKEIMEQLRGLGVQFRGGSDTEVLLAAIEQWGLDEALSRSEGMFAFALWDQQLRRLFLCRDRIGEKPLYFGWHNGAFAFASEMKAIYSIFPEKRNDIDPRALSLFCKYGYVPAPYSMNRGIFKLMPGSYISLSPAQHSLLPGDWKDVMQSGIECKQWWSLTEVVAESCSKQITNWDSAVHQLDALIRSVIKRQLTADVPVGAFLSGGIDSTLVTAIAQQESQHALKTFTIGFNDKTFDEAPFARQISANLGTDHYETYIGEQDILDLVAAIPGIYCEPHANPSVLPSILVSRIARENVKVCLSGDGGDELFGGYNRYVLPSAVFAKIQRLPPSIRKLTYNAITRLPGSYVDALHRAALNIGSKNSKRVEQSLALKLQKLSELMVHDDLNEIYEYLVSTGLHIDQLLTSSPLVGEKYLDSTGSSSMSFEESAMLADQLKYLPDDNLAKVDRASMSCSLETRLPLLNHQIIEYSWRLPLEFKIKNGAGKQILRDLLSRQVSRELFERPKMGFSVPVASWLRNELKEWMCDSLDETSLRSQGFFNPDYVRKLMADHLAGKKDHANKLWTILAFQTWYKHD